MRTRLMMTTAALALGLAAFVPTLASPAGGAHAGDAAVQTGGTFDTDALIDRDVQNAAGDEIGEIERVVIDKNGQVRHVIVSVGGFLGLGETNVAVPWDYLTFSDDGRTIVANITADELRAMPAHRYPEGREDRVYSYDDDVAANAYLRTEGDADASTREAVGQGEADDATIMTSASSEDESAEADASAAVQSDVAPAAGAAGSIRASRLMGVDVMGVDGDSLGEIEEVLVNGSGRIDGVVVDADEMRVLAWRDVTITRDEDGDLEARTALNEEQLKTRPRFEHD